MWLTITTTSVQMWLTITIASVQMWLNSQHHYQTSAIQNSYAMRNVTTQCKELYLKVQVHALHSPDFLWKSNEICAITMKRQISVVCECTVWWLLAAPSHTIRDLCNCNVVCECTVWWLLAAPSHTIRAAGQIWPNISHNAVTLADLPLNDHHDHLSLIDDTPNHFNDKHCQGNTNLLQLLLYESQPMYWEKLVATYSQDQFQYQWCSFGCILCPLWVAQPVLVDCPSQLILYLYLKYEKIHQGNLLTFSERKKKPVPS